VKSFGPLTDKNPKPRPTDLEALWRPHPAFIGPVGPPMVLWLRSREKQEAWKKRMNLKGGNDGQAAC
jgi:hypothetical protein